MSDIRLEVECEMNCKIQGMMPLGEVDCEHDGCKNGYRPMTQDEVEEWAAYWHISYHSQVPKINLSKFTYKSQHVRVAQK